MFVVRFINDVSLIVCSFWHSLPFSRMLERVDGIGSGVKSSRNAFSPKSFFSVSVTKATFFYLCLKSVPVSGTVAQLTKNVP